MKDTNQILGKSRIKVAKILVHWCIDLVNLWILQNCQW